MAPRPLRKRKLLLALLDDNPVLEPAQDTGGRLADVPDVLYLGLEARQPDFFDVRQAGLEFSEHLLDWRFLRPG
jgi:hypothetical protein